MAISTLDVETKFGFPVLAGGQENAQVTGYVRIKPSDDATAMLDHVVLVLDLSFSMADQLTPLRESVKKIIGRLKPNYDKITVIGFAGITKEFCTFESVREVQGNLEAYLPPNLPKLSGRTDFQAGIYLALKIVKKLKENGGKPNIGNESFRWVDHNHTVIFMTDGRDYGKVPWEQCEELANNGVTLHTIALNSNEINADVRKKLMKMAKIGGGGFNFCRTVETFHHKVDQLLNMSLAAVCPPTKFSLSLRSGTELILATLLEHIEQMPSGAQLAKPEFTLPAMRRDDRKIIYFRAKIGPAQSEGTNYRLFDFLQSPNLLSSPDTSYGAIPVAPLEVFKGAVKQGLNGDLRVFILLHSLESKLEQALEEAASNDDVKGFKTKAKLALMESKEQLEKTLSRNDRSGVVKEFINGFLEALEGAETVEDPSIFFNTLYAEMRTRR
jgi:uncharacterized protein YegL